jgi:hypothetical protein
MLAVTELGGKSPQIRGLVENIRRRFWIRSIVRLDELAQSPPASEQAAMKCFMAASPSPDSLG